MMPGRKLHDLMEENIIQIAPLAFMRGRTLENCFVILDEAQNATINQLKMFLTRMGENSKFIVTGDITQIDLPSAVKSGLVHAAGLLENIPGVAIIRFDQKDIIRHRLVQRIVRAYDKDDEKFLKTLLNIAASAIENAIIVEKLKNLNRDLDSKVNQLRSLFDLSKEFSSVIEKERVVKLLVFSIIGQLLVTKFAVVSFNDSDIEILESRFLSDLLISAFSKYGRQDFQKIQVAEELKINHAELHGLGVELIIPMQIKGITRGLILLGKKSGNKDYSQSDLDYISSVGSLAIISIENAQLFLDTLEKQRLESF